MLGRSGRSTRIWGSRIWGTDGITPIAISSPNPLFVNGKRAIVGISTFRLLSYFLVGEREADAGEIREIQDRDPFGGQITRKKIIFPRLARSFEHAAVNP